MCLWNRTVISYVLHGDNYAILQLKTRNMDANNLACLVLRIF